MKKAGNNKIIKKEKRLFFVTIHPFMSPLSKRKWLISDKDPGDIRKEISEEYLDKKKVISSIDIREIKRISDLLELGIDGSTMVIIDDVERHGLDDDEKRFKIVASVPEYEG